MSAITAWKPRQKSLLSFSRHSSLRLTMSSVAVHFDPSFSLAVDGDVRRPAVSYDSLAIPGVRPATKLEIRPAPDMVSFGIPSLDALTGGVPRGALTEMVGPASSGRT